MSPARSVKAAGIGQTPVERPIFFVGMPRSGTTLMFEVFAAHPDLAWFSQYFNRLAGFPAVAVLSRSADLHPKLRRHIERSDQFRHLWNQLRVGPSEASIAWERYAGARFHTDFLLDAEASPEERERLRATVSKILRYHGKPRFAAKVTGPARIGYLTSVFPDARFVHIIRDARAVVQSLLRAPFWKDTWRLREPAWQGGLTNQELAIWERLDRSPAALAALEWGAVIRTARDEAARLTAGRYREVRYEDFLSDPHTVIDQLFAFCDLADSAAPHALLNREFELRDMNRQWRDRFSAPEIDMFDDLIGDLLVKLGYERARSHSP